MTDPSLALQSAVVTALRAELTTQGYTTPNSRVLVNPEDSDALPYIVLAGETGVSFPTKTTEGMECTVSFVAWDDSLVGAKTLANYGIQALTDRTSPITVSGFTNALSELDFRDNPLREANEPDGVYWAVPFRIRYRLVEN